MNHKDFPISEKYRIPFHLFGLDSLCAEKHLADSRIMDGVFRHFRYLFFDYGSCPSFLQRITASILLS